MDSLMNYICEGDLYLLLGKYKGKSSFAHEYSVRQHAQKLFDFVSSSNDFTGIYAPFPEPDACRSLLLASALLHDVGYFINKASHHLHCSYIIKNDALLDALPDKLRLQLALCCENHRRHTLTGIEVLSQEEQRLLLQLIALLRLSDVLSSPRIHCIEYLQGEVRLRFHKDPGILFIDKLQAKSELFQALFKTRLLTGVDAATMSFSASAPLPYV